MTALYIILGILLFLFLLTLVNLRIYITYKNQLDVKIKYFTFTIVANNADKEKKASKKPAKKSTKKPKKEKEKKDDSFIKNLYNQRGISGLINILKYLVNTSVKSIAIIFNHLNIKNFNILVTVADEDAAQTAVKYGKVCATVYPLAGALIEKLNCKKYDVSVKPDFDKTECDTDCFVYAKIRLIFIIVAALKFTGIIKIVISTIKRAQSERNENENDKTNIDKNQRKDDFNE